MTLLRLLVAARYHDADLVVVPGGVAIRGTAAARDAIRDAVREHRDELVQLDRQGRLHCEYGHLLDADGACWTCHDRRCAGCRRQTGSAYLSSCDACGRRPAGG